MAFMYLRKGHFTRGIMDSAYYYLVFQYRIKIMEPPRPTVIKGKNRINFIPISIE
jgi:hypothetical protein